MNTHHVCFSGSLACSGVNPCETCFNFVNQHVLAYAMQQFPMSIEQGRHFFQLVEVGWKRLHVQMMNDPNVQQRALDVSRVRIEPLAPPAPVAAPTVGTPMFDPRMMPFASPPPPAPAAPPPSPTHAPSGFGPQPLANIYEAARAQTTLPAPAESRQEAPSPMEGEVDPEAMMAVLMSNPQFLMAVMPMMMQAMMPMMQGMPMQMMQGMPMPRESYPQEQPTVDAQPAAPPAIAFPDVITHTPFVTVPVVPAPSAQPQTQTESPTRVTQSEALGAAPKIAPPLMTEMTVDDVMMLASPVEVAAKSASADVAETLNGASTELHVTPTREPDPPRGPST